jgi:Zn-dependent protease/CBS domain-containing protein
MRWSLFLGRPFGIKLFVHWTFLILIGWIVFSNYQQGGDLNSALWSVAFVLAIFVCVTLHELGHALAARGYGISTKNINLLPIGGVASLERIPKEPKRELWVAVAGPLVNVAIAALLYVGLLIFDALPDPEALQQQSESEDSIGLNQRTFLPGLLSVNVLLVLFNAIPAFPMDGGRVLRALLAMRMDHLRATQIAVGVGQISAILFAAAGLFYNPFLLIIALFVYMGAQSELQYETTSVQLTGARVGDVVIQTYTPLHPLQPLAQAVDALLNTQETHFLVVDEGQVVGTLSRKDIIRGLREEGEEAAVRRAMRDQFPHLEAETPLEEALQVLRSVDADLLPVYRDSELIGVIDQENITEYMMVKSALSGEPNA